MKKVFWTGLTLGALLLVGQNRASAGDVILLGGAPSAPTQTLTFDGNAKNQLVWGHWHRGRGYWGGYYGGYGYGSYYPSYGYGYGYGSYYPSYGYGSYYPSYGYGYGSYYPSYGYGYGSSYYYPSYGYGYGGYYPSYYGGYGYYGVGYRRCEGDANMPPATTLNAPPQNGNGTFNYDGGPAAPMPIPGSEPASVPANSKQPRGTLLVSLPKQTTGFVSTTTGTDQTRVFPLVRQAAPARTNAAPATYSYKAYGER